MTDLLVSIRYLLKKGAKKLDVEMRVKNTAKDHRLSVNFEANVFAKGASAGGHFCVDYRNATADTEENGLRYTEMDKLPMQGFTDICDGTQGFGVVSQEFLEYDASRPGYLSCTLFRAVRNMICTEFRSGSSYPSQEGGQLQEEMKYCYGLMVHSGDWEEAGMQEESRRQRIPVLPVQFSTDVDKTGFLPGEKSFFEVRGAQASCIKMGEDRDSIILRIYNPCTEAKEAAVIFDRPVKEAYLVNMKEERINAVSYDGTGMKLVLEPDKIVTLEISL